MSDDPRLGTIVGEGYELVELLSEGTMGRLYEAWHPASGRHVAVKILDTRGMKDETLARRLLREVKALAALAHPVTVRVLDHGTLPDGGVFMVMEHLSGVTLRAVIQREGSLRPERAIRLVIALCGALEEAHQVGIVHRNLKPENVYLLSAGTDAERPKLIDFAHAKLDQARLLVSRTGLTAENTVVGTPAFMAPEQTRGEAVSARTDVYALGVVLYEAVTGRLPWDAETPAHLIERTLRGAPIPLRERCPGQIFPPGLWEVIERAMAKAPEARYPSASAFADALSALVGEDAEPPASPQGSSVALGIAVMVVVAILGGITLAIVLR